MYPFLPAQIHCPAGALWLQINTLVALCANIRQLADCAEAMLKEQHVQKCRDHTLKIQKAPC